MHIRNYPWIWRGSLVAFILLAGLTQGADVPNVPANNARPAKPDKNAVKASSIAVQAAVDALEKEVLAHVADPTRPLRGKSNYFLQNPPRQPLLPEVIIDALFTTYSADAPSDSYIKWQLLSGVQGTLEPGSAHLASIAYLEAARPLPRPGMSAAHKKELDLLLAGVKTAEDATALTTKLTDLIPPWEKRNGPVLAYRDELYAHLPQNGEALVARLEDDTQRVEAGYESEKEMKATTDAIDKWVDTKPPASHMQVMADRLNLWLNRGKPPVIPKVIRGVDPAAKPSNVRRGMFEYGEVKPFPPTFYDHVEFVLPPPGLAGVMANGRSYPGFKQWQWVPASARQIDPTTVSDLVVTLEEYIKIAKAAEMAKN